DEREIEPHPEAAMVATSAELLSVGGSMGGADTEVDEHTKNVILEAANWDLYSIRTTSMKHGIFTEAVTRFARGQSPEMCQPVQAKAAEMIAKWSGAEAASPFVDDYPREPKPVGLSVEMDKINGVLGVNLTAEEQADTLAHAEFDVTLHGDSLDILVPSWRGDISIQEDIAEEVGRIRGYDQIPVTLPYKTLKPVALAPQHQLAAKIRRIMASAGASEQLSYNFISEEFASISGYKLDSLYRLRNALSPELQYLRPSLLSSVVKNTFPNHRQGFDQLALYEINKNHSKHHLDEDKLPYERHRLALVYSASDKAAANTHQGAPFYQTALYLMFLGQGLGLDFEIKDFQPLEHFEDLESFFHSERRAVVSAGDKPIGFVGEFTDRVHQKLKLPGFAAGFEIDLDLLGEALDNSRVYQPLSKYPGTTHDVTFSLPSDKPFSEVLAAIENHLTQDDLLVKVSALDSYQDEKSTDTKNLTYRIDLQHTGKTMKTDEVNQMINLMVEKVEKAFSAKRV
ncbi:MAG: phenylalanine--tRNA ligase beta subunit-related protein, partial [Candidatus Saccharimonadales bacterium]|nr:phenylalanine--tRNA ligase beta subunit-related protein [Candidatus Saccharimonadales bacterium]